jgi:hypothetical protein
MAEDRLGYAIQHAGLIVTRDQQADGLSFRHSEKIAPRAGDWHVLSRH